LFIHPWLWLADTVPVHSMLHDTDMCSKLATRPIWVVFIVLESFAFLPKLENNYKVPLLETLETTTKYKVV